MKLALKLKCSLNEVIKQWGRAVRVAHCLFLCSLFEGNLRSISFCHPYLLILSFSFEIVARDSSFAEVWGLANTQNQCPAVVLFKTTYTC